MKKKGFTLIELLAVIVVLAIIALIATPIVMNTIKSAKKGAAERSADSYISAVETTVATAKLDGKDIPDGTYQIDGEGNLTGESLPNGKLTIDMKGNKPKSGTITISNGQVTNDSEMTVGDYDVKYNEDKKKYEATDKENSSTIVYRWSTDEIHIGDSLDITDTSKFTKDPSTLGKIEYLKHVLDKENKVTKTYACAKLNGKEYCLTNVGYEYTANPSDYTGNVLILKQIEDAKIEGISCDFARSLSRCTSESVGFYARSYGYVFANGAASCCAVTVSGSSICGVGTC